ncbi:MAG: DUF503 domain-containing protein [Candidatus Omnitrophica bacterium]|nr:DUF503 domain-containing protein [Candidatus Omnitrophota bacterium]
MHIGSLQIKLRISEANSLKSKRFVIRSLQTRIRSKFNVSVSEIGDQDLWQSSLVGICMVAGERAYVNEVLDKVLDLVRSETRAELIDFKLEFI